MYEAYNGEVTVREVQPYKNIHIKESVSTTNHNLICWYTNADSLMNKREELIDKMRTAETKPDIICITEVKPKSLRYELDISEINCL